MRLRFWTPARGHNSERLEGVSPAKAGRPECQCHRVAPARLWLSRPSLASTAPSLNSPRWTGRVGVWRGGVRPGMSVCRPFRLAVP